MKWQNRYIHSQIIDKIIFVHIKCEGTEDRSKKK